MAVPSSTPLALSGDNVIDASTHGYYWSLGADRTIKWSLSNGFNTEFWNSPAQAATTIDQIFNTFSYYANIKFQYVGYFSNPIAASSSSDINISLDIQNIFFDSRDNPPAWARGFFPNGSDFSNGYYAGRPGDIYLNVNSAANNLPSYLPGSAGYFLFLHEIGHTIGLKHTFDDGGTGRPTLTALGSGLADSDWFSIMSYNDNFQSNVVSWDPATPMLLDVLGLQYLYGRNMSTNAGDSVYTLPLNNAYTTIWDAGGRDTINLAGSPVGWNVALPDVQLSSLVPTKANIARPLNGTFGGQNTFYWLTGDIEDAIGSAFADTITGSALNNILSGGGGNDAIDGGGGLDSVVYSGIQWNFTVVKTATGYRITDWAGSEGSDTLANVERVFFADKTLALDINGTAGQAYRLYQAAFNRVPDKPGLGLWINQIDKGVSLTTVAGLFEGSAEFISLYGANASNSQLVTLLYNNVLHRAPEASALPFWVNILDAHQQSREQILANFSESPENQAQVLGTIQNGIEYVYWTG